MSIRRWRIKLSGSMNEARQLAPPASLDQRGMALAAALLVLLVSTALVSATMMGICSDSRVAGHAVGESRALNSAEAGVAEALERLSAREVPDNGNAGMVTQIFLCQPGSVPVLGADSTALATSQPAAQWLDYSTAARGPDVLTVQYKTDPAKTTIYRYDPALHPPIQTASGTPIYVITSTGRKGGDTRTVVAEVIERPLVPNPKAAFVSGVNIDLSGSSVVCGHNHRADTPIGAGRMGQTGLGGCDEDPGMQHWETGSGDMTGVWSSGKIGGKGNGQQFGSPALAEHQPGFYSGPWDALGLTQSDFFAWVGAPQAVAPLLPTGVIYLDNNSTTQDQSGAWAYQGGDGEGLLYADGDLTLNGNFSFRGMIYVEGDLMINGDAWILGSIICRGHTVIKLANGNLAVLYSHDAITQNIAHHAANQFVNLSWREIY